MVSAIYVPPEVRLRRTDVRFFWVFFLTELTRHMRVENKIKGVIDLN